METMSISPGKRQGTTMRTRRYKVGKAWLFVTGLTILGVCAVGVRAGGPEKSAKPEGSPSTNKTDSTAKPAEKLVKFEMRDKPWPLVLEWLSDQTGMSWSTTHKPTGTYSFIGPKSGSNMFTIPEVIDKL